VPLRRLVVTILLAGALTAGVAGCGLDQAAPGSKAVRLLVTRNFGTVTVGTSIQHRIPQGESDLTLLERRFSVRTDRPRGATVQAIDGIRADAADYREWSFYINGILVAKKDARSAVHPGDHIWWDFHDTAADSAVPAVVGGFPEPFTNGIGGQRLPTVLDCAPGVQRACGVVARTLTRVGVKVADQELGGGSGSDSLAVVVGTYAQLRGLIATELIAAGPSKSGVYAQFDGRSGSRISLDDPLGRVVRTLGGSVGLIAATEQRSLNQPAWLVTGTDAAGVEDAARALTPTALAGHFAVVVVGARVIPVPLQPGM
jgi:hypothetical protein